MKAGNFILMPSVFLLACGCGNNQNEKRDNGPVEIKDTTVAVEKLPSIEKEFADTVNLKPVKDSVWLKFNFQKGKVYNYTMMLDAAQKKGDMSMSTSMKWNYDMLVVEEKKGVKTLQATYRRIDMTMDRGNDQKMEFSSEKKVDAMDFMQMPSKMFSIIKGKSFTMQVNEKGEVISVNGFDKIGEAVVQEMNLPEEMKPMLRQNFQKQFNDEAVKQMLSQSFDFFPDKYVKVGDRWKTSTTVSAIRQDIATVYTVRNIKGNKVFVSGESKLSSTEGKGSGTQTSRLIIDARTGLMIDGVFEQHSGGAQVNSKTRIIGKEI